MNIPNTTFNGPIESEGARYVPPKNWKDLTADEKAERLREVVKGLQQSLNICAQKVDELRGDFLAHSHAEGQLVRKMGDRPYGNIGYGGLAKLANPEQEAKGEVYF